MDLTFEYQDAIDDSRKYFKGDELAANVFVTKYALTDKSGKILESNPVQMHRRLAQEFFRIEASYPNPMSEEEIYQLLKDFKYVVPQGSPMSGIGNCHQVQSISNCFDYISSYNFAPGLSLISSLLCFFKYF